MIQTWSGPAIPGDLVFSRREFWLHRRNRESGLVEESIRIVPESCLIFLGKLRPGKFQSFYFFLVAGKVAGATHNDDWSQDLTS